jgi:hypothetical protein
MDWLKSVVAPTQSQQTPQVQAPKPAPQPAPKPNPQYLVNQLTPLEKSAIHQQQMDEENNTIRDPQYKQKIEDSMNKIRKRPNEIGKALVGAIGEYNVFRRRADNLTLRNTSLFNSKKSGYPCGTETCKTRGKLIQNELKYLANLDIHALGEMGVLGNVASLGNYLIGNKVKEYRPDVSVSKGGSKKRKTSRTLKKRR